MHRVHSAIYSDMRISRTKHGNVSNLRTTQTVSEAENAGLPFPAFSQRLPGNLLHTTQFEELTELGWLAVHQHTHAIQPGGQHECEHDRDK